MRARSLLGGITVAAALAGAAPAAADIIVTTPPNPILPPETVLLVNQPAPVEVQVLFGGNPGPPNVQINPCPPTGG
jgi:hypothetical protein